MSESNIALKGKFNVFYEVCTEITKHPSIKDN